MDVYIYRADLYCPSCVQNSLRNCELCSATGRPQARCEPFCDPDCCPQGPDPDGGGEADSPQHCGGCGLFLENPLTEEGVEYIRESFRDHAAGRGAFPEEWVRFYGHSLPISGHAAFEGLESAVAEYLEWEKEAEDAVEAEEASSSSAYFPPAPTRDVVNGEGPEKARKDLMRFVGKNVLITWDDPGEPDGEGSMVGVVNELTDDGWLVVDWGGGIRFSAIKTIREWLDADERGEGH